MFELTLQLEKESSRTADGMVPGGWVRWPGRRRWWQIVSVTSRPGNTQDRFVEYRVTDGDVVSRRVRAIDTFAYMTDDAFQAACDKAA